MSNKDDLKERLNRMRVELERRRSSLNEKETAFINEKDQDAQVIKYRAYRKELESFKAFEKEYWAVVAAFAPEGNRADEV